ncbi:hypothetical protein LCGC14_0562600 [marine sediment metagenome]|uniref:Uncharacterized protein n=1 Tax=marine sediment metagenome TaxID=412755 RepID=A0A0F9UUS7_9ZZZZ
MSKKKKNNENLNIEYKVDEKIKVVKNILNSLEQIFMILSPLLDKVLLMEDADTYRKNGNFKTLIDLFDNISKESQKLSSPFFNSEFPEDISDLRN